MRRVLTCLVVAGVLAGVLTAVAGAPASAAPPSSDPPTDAAAAAAWLARQVSASGFIPVAGHPAQANLSVSAQAVIALAAAGVGRAQVDALLGYLGDHVDDFVAAGGADDPGALSYLILAAEAAGADPASFGASGADLVARLLATQQPDGLFGAADPTFDGAFREGLSLLALESAGVANPAGVAWLEVQQCGDGSWTSFRSDVSVPCPPVDPSTFSGPDTNSTALAVLGLEAQGATMPASAGVAALDAVRNADGGWGFLARADQATDADSTGLVLEALRTATGAPDGPGIDALLRLQAGCGARAADQGGIAFQPGPGGALAPDLLATAQAAPALAEVALPVTGAAIADGVPSPCAAVTTTTGGVTSTTSTTTTRPVIGAEGSTVAPAVAPGAGLPRTGSSPAPLALAALVLLAAGAALVGGARRAGP